MDTQFKVYFAVLPERTGSANYECWTASIKMAMYGGDKGFGFLEIPYIRVDHARNWIVGKFIKLSENPNDMLVMIDADHKYEPDIVERLSQHNPEMGVVGTLLFRRGHPHDPLFFSCQEDGGKLVSPNDWERGGVYQCDATGSGVFGIRRWVFNKLEESGFNYPFFRYEYKKEDNFSQSEDVRFALCCYKAKIHHYCDTSLEAPHLVVEWADEKRWNRHLNMLNYAKPDRILVIMPSANRPEQAAKCVERLFETTEGWHVKCAVIIEPLPNQTDYDKIVAQYRKHLDSGHAEYFIKQEWSGPVNSWNLGISTWHDWDCVIYAGDDLWWGDGWLNAAMDKLEELPQRNGLVGFNDGKIDGNELASHFLMTKDFCRKYHGGVLAVPHYVQFSDTETTMRAQRARRYVWAEMARVDHRHPLFNKAESDETYVVGGSSYKKDEETFKARASEGFQDDFDPMI